MLSTGLSGGALVIFILMTLIQITPIKINPWSYLFNKFGDAFNKRVHEELADIKTNMNNMKDDLQKIKSTDDERYAVQCRIRILRFNDELIENETGHSKDYFDQILMDIDEYERYCEVNPKFKNNMTYFAIDNIKRCYHECLVSHKFLIK